MMNALLAGFVGLVLSAPVVAEPLLEGMVRFASGEPAAAVRVRVFDMSDLQRGAVAQATTNPAGYFALPLSALYGSALPEGFTLGANYPNPFNPSTIIPYQLASLSEVRLEVFNLLGQRVTTLVEGEQPAGFHAATWHATDATGRAVGAGVYIYRLAVGAASQTGRMVLLDGQAGVSAVRAGPVLPAAAGDEARVYGLLVEGPGLVPYMDEAFRVEVGMAPVELVVSAGSYWAGKVTKACALCGFLGDAATDSTALVALYNATDGDNWTNNTNWLSDRPLGEWHGVFTDDDERVTQLSLSRNQLRGSIPTELGNLTSLQHLHLYGNQLSGAIPAELGNLTNLQNLYLHQNQLSGEIPTELGNLTNLTGLSLSENQLSGEIPAALGNLTNLIELNLSSNQLSGEIPAALGNLTNLTGLYLLFNQLSGEIPTELGNLTNLTELYLSSNQLSGQIPPELGNLANLQFLILYDNQLSGQIPPELGNLSNLTRLSLGSNQLSGCLPEGLGHVENHDLLTLGLLSCGADEGDVTTDRAALAALYEATDGDNWKDNTHWLSDRPLGEWHGVTTNADGRVTGLSLYGNQLSGSIPPELSNLPYLQSLNLSQNQLSGSIPPELGNLANLQFLNLSSNQLSGSIPPELGNFPYLTHLYLYGNQLSGSIPPELGNLTSLTQLWLAGNRLSGSIPAELGNLANLQRLSLSANELSGCLPDDLWDISPDDNDFAELDLPFCDSVKDGATDEGDETTDEAALVALYEATDGDNWTNNTNWLSDRPLGEWHGVTTNDDGQVTRLALDENQLSGSIPVELGNLTNLTYLSLRENQLSGSIPVELGNLTNLTELRLYGNQLSGSIPAALGNLTNLTWLDLYGNQLSGSIPPALGNLTNLQYLWLSGNQLSGCVPEGLRNATDDFSDLGLPSCDPAKDGATDEGDETTDRAALVALYNATNGDNWTNNTNWLSDRPLGEWHGVTTDADGRVTGLNLHENQLSGELPPELGNLSNLKWLYLSQNQLSGSIPADLGNLAKLERLGFFGNQLSDSIPPELGNLSSLTYLDLRANQLSGSIPPELGNLANLTELHLSTNQLSGSIPPELGNLANLTYLDLHENQLSGCVPEGLRNEGINNSFSIGLPFCGEGDEATDRAALVALYNATDGDNWKNKTNWLSDRPLGEWHGVSTFDGRVRSLNLQINDLSGTIPPELGNLSKLETLIITSSNNSDNQLRGPIPPELGNLTNLTELWLSNNQLSGTIPPELGNLTNLTELRLNYNQLIGTIPPELGNLTNLTRLFLNSNQLSGPIPAALGNLTNLTELGLDADQLSGCVPEGLRNVRDNDLLPFCGEGDETADRAALVALYNATDGDNWTNNTNWLSDRPLGEWHGVTTDDDEWVTSLELSGNQLSGSIPPELGNLAYLTGLNLTDNQISGAIPAELGNLWHLQYLYLGANQLSGCVPAGLWKVSDNDFADNGLSFCFLAGDGAALVALYEAMGGDGWKDNTNWLSDRPLGAWHGVTVDANGRVTRLNLSGRRLDRSGNGLSGSIPPEVGNLSNLVELIFSGNQLSGSIPPEVGKLTNLTYLDLYDNQLSGSIPPELGNLSKLRELDLRRNQLSGSIPPEVGNLSNLVELYLSSNQLSGPIPPELGNLSRLGWLDLYDNQLSGSIPPEVGNLSNLVELNLSGNQLSGPILPELGNLSRLKMLNLSGNQLSGPIPPELGNLSNLASLWLGLNNLTDISVMGGLSSLTSLDLRGNLISLSSINASISALRRDAIVYHDHPLLLSKSDFDIELVFLNDVLTKNRFTEFQKRQIQYAAQRWMSIIRGDLPDYTIPQVLRGNCGDQPYSPPLGERIDDLRIYVNVEELEEVKSYIGGVEEEVKPSALAGPQVIRWGEAGEPAAFLAVTGCMKFDLSWVDPNAYHIDPMPLIDISLHEMGHVLGFGTWNESGFLQDSSDDPHFNGPLAIAAFDDAGGQNYTGAKVPVEPDGAHWRSPELSGELMGTGGSGLVLPGRSLSAITIQALADIGYVVDVTQADPYTLPDAAAAKVATFHSHGTEREPIYVVDPQGRIIRTLSH